MKDPIREALEEILAQAKKYQAEPLMSKLKSKVVVVEESPDQEDEQEDNKIGELKKDDSEELDEATKRKLRELLGV